LLRSDGMARGPAGGWTRGGPVSALSAVRLCRPSDPPCASERGAAGQTAQDAGSLVHAYRPRRTLWKRPTLRRGRVRTRGIRERGRPWTRRRGVPRSSAIGSRCSTMRATEKVSPRGCEGGRGGSSDPARPLEEMAGSHSRRGSVLRLQEDRGNVQAGAVHQWVEPGGEARDDDMRGGLVRVSRLKRARGARAYPIEIDWCPREGWCDESQGTQLLVGAGGRRVALPHEGVGMAGRFLKRFFPRHKQERGEPTVPCPGCGGRGRFEWSRDDAVPRQWS
jgi:hypothetical protein